MSEIQVLFNGINLVSAGTLATGKSLVRALIGLETDYVLNVILPAGYGYEEILRGSHINTIFFERRKFNSFWRLWFDFVLLPRLVKDLNVAGVISLGNHAAAKLDVPKVVLFRNAYYVDPVEGIGLKEYLKKRLEILFFSQTVSTASKIVVQGESMKKRLAAVWNIPDAKLSIVPNALSEKFAAAGGCQRQEIIPKERLKKDKGFGKQLVLLYVSRYYPHKNHRLILELARKFASKGDEIVILTTMNESDNDVKSLLNERDKEGLNSVFINLGEIEQEELSDWYLMADALFFPSKLESFGNPFIEAMNFGLPILAADKPYAHDVCGDAATYFDPTSVDDAYNKVSTLVDQSKSLKEKGFLRLKSFPNWDTVAKTYLQLIADEISTQKR
ncbi:hypothetical protein R50073_26830 [Maricurvus nonylphenolicus]|uniref:glycosyltransferase n=1 Tax=Maricurvus nonylphenolicus TaxID=1008307 RepID=UPI0036F2B6BA